MSYYYISAFIISFILTMVYAFRWHKHFDVYFTLVFVLIPLVDLGYIMRYYSKSLDAAINAQKLIYIGGCFLIVFIMFSIFSLCKINISKIVRTMVLIGASLVYGLVLTIGYLPIFYSKVSFVPAEGIYGAMLQREYGWGHTVFYVMVFSCFAASFAAIIYSFLRKKQVSRRIQFLLFVPEIVSLFSYFGRGLLSDRVELVPASYVFAQIMYLLIAHRIRLYNISETVTDSLLYAGNVGFVSLDFKERYLGSSELARKVLPELNELYVDKPADQISYINDTLLYHLRIYQENEEKRTFYLQREGAEEVYQVTIQDLYDNDRKRGYQFVLSDDTRNQKYIALLNHYNSDLEAEVQKKTENLVLMHNNLILGMATMVESRDNSTGGHIRRTSEGVRILINEMRKDPEVPFTEKFCSDLIKAAPMHDLGKIAVDDAVLRKPGRFTPEEFEKMKKHSVEGARIVREILKDTDDKEFQILAEHVAHYHHERWDGSGYPDGLKGEEIPIEARIMAIADVYDALVSKRVYKDAMSFEQANKIILEGMGQHFDKQLEPYYLNARPYLEAYYSSM